MNDITLCSTCGARFAQKRFGKRARRCAGCKVAWKKSKQAAWYELRRKDNRRWKAQNKRRAKRWRTGNQDRVEQYNRDRRPRLASRRAFSEATP